MRLHGLPNSVNQRSQDLSRTALEHERATSFVNAAIMDENGEPSNAPWVLDLD